VGKKCFQLIFYFIIVSCHTYCQEGDRWALGLGKTIGGLNFYNIRIISPYFKYESTDDYWTEEEEKNPEKFKKGKGMVEMLIPQKYDSTWTPIFLFSSNMYYCFVKKKYLAASAFGGITAVLDFSTLHRGYYGPPNSSGIVPNAGLNLQFNFVFVLPYIEVSLTGLTIGSELRLSKIYRNPKRRYHLNLKN
jgi:hypothetical protein